MVGAGIGAATTGVRVKKWETADIRVEIKIPLLSLVALGALITSLFFPTGRKLQ